MRFRYDDKPSKSIDPKNPVKHFWAYVVWNYQEERIQILQITQKTIYGRLFKLAKDSDWGSASKYDIKIEKEGSGKETEYTVTAIPPKPVSDHIKKEFSEFPVNLEGLFDGEDPFSKSIRGDFDIEASKRNAELKDLLGKCSKEFQDKLNSFMEKNRVTIDTAREKLYETIEKAILKNYQESQQQAVAS